MVKVYLIFALICLAQFEDCCGVEFLHIIIGPSRYLASRSSFDNGQQERANGVTNYRPRQLNTRDGRDDRAGESNPNEDPNWQQPQIQTRADVGMQQPQGAAGSQWDGQSYVPQTVPQPNNVQVMPPSASGAAGAKGANSGSVPSRGHSGGPARPPAQKSQLDHFSTNLYQKVLPGAQRQNMIYSPTSVQTLLGLLYFGATDATAQELQYYGGLPNNKGETAVLFRQLLDMQQSSPKSQLIVASKIIYNPNAARLKDNYATTTQQYFGSDVEPADFSQPARTANDVNAWVASKTNNRIQNLISPSAIDSQTQAIAVTAVYFKARWAKEFSQMDTMPAKFQVGNKQAVDVDMMYNDDMFDYADLDDLDAKALELPYDESDLSMLFILPNKVNGLSALEQRLANVDLNEVAARLRSETTTVRLPKFQIDFDIDMTTPLKNLGIQRVFSNNAELGEMFDAPVKVSKVQQRAHITVNEAGSEAAASTYAKFVPLSLPVKVKEFTADHPFFFAIRSPQAVLFIGHVINPQR